MPDVSNDVTAMTEAMREALDVRGIELTRDVIEAAAIAGLAALTRDGGILASPPSLKEGDRAPSTITERDRLALLGGVQVISLYQRTIDETIRLLAGVVNVEPEPYGGAPYYGVLSDELESDATPEVIVRRILTHYKITVREDVSEDHVQRQEREAEAR